MPETPMIWWAYTNYYVAQHYPRLQSTLTPNAVSCSESLNCFRAKPSASSGLGSGADTWVGTWV
jgi:hypothetical protein